MDDPFYKRRLKGTPAKAFAKKYSAIIVGIGLAIGVGFHFLATFIRPEGPRKFTRLENWMRERRDILQVSLVPPGLGHHGPEKDDESED